MLEPLDNGTPVTYEQLVRQHAPRMLRLAERVLGDTADAADVVQEAFISAWKNLAQFHGRSTFGTWIHRITLHAALAGRRQRSRRNEVAMDDERAAAHEPAYTPQEDRDRAEQIWHAVDTLADELRTVLILRDIEEMSSKEVAAALAINDALVRQRLHRARQIVAERLRPELRQAPSVTCGGNLDLLFDLIDDTLDDSTRASVEGHVGACHSCQGLQTSYHELAEQQRWAQRNEINPRQVDAVVSSVLASLTQGAAPSS